MSIDGRIAGPCSNNAVNLPQEWPLFEWKSLKRLNVIAMGCTLASGFGVGMIFSRPYLPAPPDLQAVSIYAAVWDILQTNLWVLWLMMCSILSFGAFSLLIVLWNGFRCGLILSVVLRAEPETVLFMLPYLPLELGALCLAAASTQRLGVSVFKFLIQGRPLENVAASFHTYFLAVAFTVQAAFLEGLMKAARAYLCR